MKFNIFNKIFSHNTQQDYAYSLKTSKKLAQKYQEYKPSTLSKGQNLAKSLEDQLNTNAELIMSQNQNISIEQKSQLLDQNFVLDKAKHKVDIKNLILKMNDIQYNYYDNTQIPSIPLSPYIRENYIDERILLEKKENNQDDNLNLQNLDSIQSYQNRKFERKLQKTKQESEMIENGQLNLDEWQSEEKNYSNPAYKLRVLQNIDNFRKAKKSLVEKEGLHAILKQKKLKLPKLTKAKIQDDTFTTSENGNLNITNRNAGLVNIPLNLNQRDFNQLFSPDDKKFQIQQSDIQDCFLVSTLESILKNPKARAKYYQCFSKDKDGSFQFTFADDFKVKFPKDEQGNPSTFKTVSSNLKGDLGHQLFEQAYAIKRMNDFATLAINSNPNNTSLIKALSSFQNQQLKNLQNGNGDIDQVFNQLSQIVSRYNLQPDQNNSLLYKTIVSNSIGNNYTTNTFKQNFNNLNKSLANADPTILKKIDPNLYENLQNSFNNQKTLEFNLKKNLHSLINNRKNFIDFLNTNKSSLNTADKKFIQNLIDLTNNLDANYDRYLGVSGILFTGESSEIFSSIFNKAQFVGSKNRYFNIDSLGNNKDSVSVNYKKYKSNLLNNHSEDLLVNMQRLPGENGFEQNELRHNHVYSIDSVDVKSQESYLVDPEQSENLQVVDNNEINLYGSLYYKED